MKYSSNTTDQLLAEKLNDSSIDRVMAIDREWNIMAWNNTSALLSGYSKEEVMGKHLLDAFPVLKQDPEVIEAIEQGLLGRKSFLPSKPKHFNREHVENHFIPLLNDDGQVMGVMNIMHDVAHRVKVEKQLQILNNTLEKKYRELEKVNNDLATFTYVASREIQEPIKNVYTSLEFIARREGSVLSNISRGSLRKMQASLSRLNLLLDDLLAISRINNHSDSLASVDLNTIVENVRSKMNAKLQAKNVALSVGQLPLIKGSAEMLGYLFQHLLDNAIKFQPEDNSPAVTIYWEQLENDDKTESEGYHCIAIRDNGIGFEQKDVDTIFDMFTTLQRQTFRGSGIGLALCKRIMEMHEGMITAESAAGEGATFRCYFPTVC